MTDQLELHSLRSMWDECVYFQEVGVCMDTINFQKVELLTGGLWCFWIPYSRKEHLTVRVLINLFLFYSWLCWGQSEMLQKLLILTYVRLPKGFVMLNWKLKSKLTVYSFSSFGECKGEVRSWLSAFFEFWYFRFLFIAHSRTNGKIIFLRNIINRNAVSHNFL